MPYIFGKSRRQTGHLPEGRDRKQASRGKTMRTLKVLAVVILAVAAGLAGYAYLGDMEPVRREVRTPLALESR